MNMRVLDVKTKTIKNIESRHYQIKDGYIYRVNRTSDGVTLEKTDYRLLNQTYFSDKCPESPKRTDSAVFGASDGLEKVMD